MRLKKITSFILLVAQISLLTGCWNYREIENLALVDGAAIDFDKETGKYRLTVEIINPRLTGQQTQLQQVVTYYEGKTFYEAVRLLISKVGKKLYWSHTKVLVVSQQIAEKGIAPVLDFLNRNVETRSDIWVVVSKDKTADTIFSGGASVHDTVSFHINDTLRNETNLAGFKPVRLWEFIYHLSEEGISATAPAVYMDPNNKTIPITLGTAVFKKDKLVGWLTGAETRSLLFLVNKITDGVLVVPDTDSQKQSITFEILGNRTTVKPVFHKGQLEMDINIVTRVDLGEVEGTIDVISNPKLRKMVEKETENEIKKDIKSTIKKVQKDFDTDIFGFGILVHRNMPGYWKQVRPKWDQMFRNIKTNIKVDLQIKSSSLKSKPIKIGE